MADFAVNFAARLKILKALQFSVLMYRKATMKIETAFINRVIVSVAEFL